MLFPFSRVKAGYLSTQSQEMSEGGSKKIYLEQELAFQDAATETRTFFVLAVL